MTLPSFYTSVGLIGLICYGLAAISVSNELFPSDWSKVVITLWVAVALAGHLWFCTHYARRWFSSHLGRTFVPLCALGILALLLSIGNQFDGTTPPTSALGGLLDIAAAYSTLLYFLWTFSVFGQFILSQKRKIAYRVWRLFNPLLSVYAFSQIFAATWLPFVITALLGLGILVWLPLLLQLRWVAVLDKTEKWQALVYLGLLTILSSILIGAFLSTEPNTHITLHTLYAALLPRDNLFLYLLMFAVWSYGLLSFLALVFGMPVASFIAEQRDEIERFQVLSRSTQDKINAQELLQRLFTTCLSSTDSDAGWLLEYASDGTERITAHRLSSEQIGFLRVKSNFKDLIKPNVPFALPDEPSRRAALPLTEPAPAPMGSSASAPMRVVSGIIGKRLRYDYYFPYLTREVVYNKDDTAVKSMLILPVYSSVTQRMAGVVCLCKSFSDGYNNAMIELAKSYVAQAQLSLEHWQLVSETVQTARYKREWEIASRVQQALMPLQFPDLPHCQIPAFTEPAVEVGGDYYDYARLGNRIALVVGDVSGKGASAAFYMAQMKGIFQTLMQFDLDATTFMQQANHAVAKCLDRKHYITIAYLLLDLDTNTATYSRAGHCPMVRYCAATHHSQLYMGKGTGLGVIRNDSFADFVESQQINLAAGDVLLLYTDGLVEGRPQDSEEQYGYERLKKCLAEYHQLSANQIVQHIYADFKAFTYGSNFKDDTSLLVVKMG